MLCFGRCWNCLLRSLPGLRQRWGPAAVWLLVCHSPPSSRTPNSSVLPARLTLCPLGCVPLPLEGPFTCSSALCVSLLVDPCGPGPHPSLPGAPPLLVQSLWLCEDSAISWQKSRVYQVGLFLFWCKRCKSSLFFFQSVHFSRSFLKTLDMCMDFIYFFSTPK